MSGLVFTYAASLPRLCSAARLVGHRDASSCGRVARSANSYTPPGRYLRAFFTFAHRVMTAARAWSLVRALRFPLALPPLDPIAAAAALRGIGLPQWGQFIGCGSF